MDNKVINKKHKYVNKQTKEILYLYKEDPILNNNNNIVKTQTFIVTARDKNGKCFGVWKDDERLKTNELIPSTTKYTINCKIHNLQKIQSYGRKKSLNVDEKYKIYCPKCIDLYLSEKYKPSQDDIDLCNEFLNTHNFINSYHYTEKFFKKILPHFFTIINKHSENSKISFSKKILLYKHNNNNPKCLVKNCNNNVDLYKLHPKFKLYCSKHENFFFSSKPEIDVLNFVKENYNGIVKSNYRKFGKELDVYIPDLKIAIEFNGLYWHSSLFKEKTFHQNKWKMCNDKGIKLITIWEDDWNFKQDIIKSIILNSLLKTKNKGDARKCNIRNIDYTTSKQFLDKNHIQGSCMSSIRLGLYYEDKLFSLMTFGKKRKILGQTSKEDEYELLRFCNKINYNIRGSASKLFSNFIKTYSPIQIISYANLDISNGNLYEVLGFKNLGLTAINYWWANDKRMHRSNFMKHKLVEKGFDKNKTETEIMLDRKFHKIWGVGNLKYIWQKQLG